MKRMIAFALAGSLGLYAIADVRQANATPSNPVIAASPAAAAQDGAVAKVQWRRFGPGFRGGRPGYRWRPGYGWVPLAVLGTAAAVAAGAYYYGPRPYYYGPGPYYYGPAPYYGPRW